MPPRRCGRAPGTAAGSRSLGHFVLVNRIAALTIPQGAATTVWAGFVAPTEEVGGLYCEDCHVAEPAEGEDMRGGVRAYALDPAHAQALWAKSEAMARERF